MGPAQAANFEALRVDVATRPLCQTAGHDALGRCWRGGLILEGFGDAELELREQRVNLGRTRRLDQRGIRQGHLSGGAWWCTSSHT